MSTIVTDTITGKSTATTITIGSTPVVSASANSMTIRGEGSNQTSIQQGLAKAWGHLNMSTGSFADSFNNSSATDFQTGSFHHNFTNAFGNSSYSISGSHNLPSGNTCSILVGYDDSARFTTSSVNVAAFNVTNGRVDATKVLTKVVGDLA